MRKEGLKDVERKEAERVKDGAEDTREHAGCAIRWDTNRVRRCPGAGSVGSVGALAVEVEVEANHVAIGGGGLVWNIAAVEVEEEEKTGGWQLQKRELKKQNRMERAAVKEPAGKIEAERAEVKEAERAEVNEAERVVRKEAMMMKAVVGDEGDVKRMFIGAVEEVATIGMNFQVCEVKKALAAVRRICKAGSSSTVWK